MSGSRPPDRTAPGPLARLDGAVVPRLQSLAQGTGRVLGWPFRALTQAELDTRLGRALHRNGGLLLLAAVAVGFLASAVHLQRYPDLRVDAGVAGEEGLPGGEGGAGAPAETDDEVPTAVGPVLGADIAAYVDRRSQLVAGLPDGDPMTAVVSYVEYRTPQAVVASLPADAEVLGGQYRLPADGERPLRVETDRQGLVGAVEEAVAAALGSFAAEEDEVQRLLESGTVEDEDFQRDLERRLSELRSLRERLDGEAPVVFAVIVRAPPVELRALSEHADVRLVDVAGATTDARSTVFYGVLPEDRDRATFGRGL